CRFQPGWKVSPQARTLAKTDKPSLSRVSVQPGIPASSVASAIRPTNAVVTRTGVVTLLFAADPAQVEQIAVIEGVRWIDEYVIPSKHTDAAGQLTGVPVAHTRGYDGSTQTIAIADTGLGSGTKNNAHPDISPNRITAVHPWSGSGAF